MNIKQLVISAVVNVTAMLVLTGLNVHPVFYFIVGFNLGVFTVWAIEDTTS